MNIKVSATRVESGNVFRNNNLIVDFTVKDLNHKDHTFIWIIKYRDGSFWKGSGVFIGSCKIFLADPCNIPAHQNLIKFLRDNEVSLGEALRARDAVLSAIHTERMTWLTEELTQNAEERCAAHEGHHEMHGDLDIPMDPDEIVGPIEEESQARIAIDEQHDLEAVAICLKHAIVAARDGSRQFARVAVLSAREHATRDGRENAHEFIKSVMGMGFPASFEHIQDIYNEIIVCGEGFADGVGGLRLVIDAVESDFAIRV